MLMNFSMFETGCISDILYVAGVSPNAVTSNGNADGCRTTAEKPIKIKNLLQMIKIRAGSGGLTRRAVLQEDQAGSMVSGSKMHHPVIVRGLCFSCKGFIHGLARLNDTLTSILQP